MPAPRFSVVIPTRERADTLRVSLRTCLDQSFDDYEVVVSDNCSTPATRAAVDELASPKVRYVRTPEPVAMSANWEFGVSQARGEYVTVLGDDDALLPHALAELDGLVGTARPPAVRWELAFYTWPGFGVAGHDNYLRVPLGGGVEERDGAAAVRHAAAAPEQYEVLPMVYNAVVRRDLLDGLRARTGAVFPHHIPDVYSGFAVAHAAGRYVSTARPLSVRGVSKASYGVAALFDPGRTAVEREFRALNEKGGFRPDPRVPALPVLPAVIAETLLFAADTLFPEAGVEPDRRALARACLERTRAAEADWPAVLAAIRRSLADSPELTAWFDAELAAAPYAPPGPVVYFKPPQLGFDGAQLHLDAAAFGVADVAAAARLCARLVGTDPAARPVAPAAALAAAAAALDARDRAVLGVHVSAYETYARRTAEWHAERGRADWYLARVRELEAACAERGAIVERADAQIRALTAQLQAERGWSLKRPLRGVKKVLAKLTRAA